MSSVGESLEKFMTDTVSSVNDFVHHTGEHVAGMLKDVVGVKRQNSEQESSDMGNSKSKAPSTTPPPVPPFNVAYGVNAGGKTVLYPIDVSKELAHMSPLTVTVHDLQMLLESLTSVPVARQSLIYKGTHLRGEQRLVDVQIRHGAKLMMLGQAETPRDPDEDIKKRLSPLEDEISTVSMELLEMEMFLDAIPRSEKGAFQTAHKRLLHLNEALMKTVMKIDAVDIPAERAEARGLRKALVERVHVEMGRVDRQVERCVTFINMKSRSGSRSRSGSPKTEKKGPGDAPAPSAPQGGGN